ncbi:hypothetical protein E2C01_101082 [Portunus trituberculatus]|uniref:Uncharacterized protein n=1 Tax=Portunus trituberculatus TaxID=210409 RepID=A0A5B7K9Q5_PORTR|nr:hypothetical protein [Portunus trituberculatus]
MAVLRQGQASAISGSCAAMAAVVLNADSQNTNTCIMKSARVGRDKSPVTATAGAAPAADCYLLSGLAG